MGAKQVLVSVLVAIGLGITGMFATQSDRALGATVKFDNTMVVNKNLTDGGGKSVISLMTVQKNIKPIFDSQRTHGITHLEEDYLNQRV